MSAETTTPTQAPEAPRVPRRGIKAYIAARGQDQELARHCRAQLQLLGVTSTARWIDEALIDETHVQAQMDIDDVRAADLLVLIKPKTSHQFTTGGHHVETGIAIERGMPILLLGEQENVFHQHPSVYVMPWPVSSREDLALVLGLIAPQLVGEPEGVRHG